MLKDKISNDEYRLYKLIWERTIGAFMPASIIKTNIVRISNNGHKFYAYEEAIIFDGYKKILGKAQVDSEIKLILKDLKVGEKFNFQDQKLEEHTSEPPPRYNQGSLITALDESGVGRPSTFRTMANIGVDRGYVHIENKAFFIEKIGSTIIENLEKYFPDVINIDFTRKMEEHLDEIAEGDEN
jgi:DNA topoisomerase-1